MNYLKNKRNKKRLKNLTKTEENTTEMTTKCDKLTLFKQAI